MKNEEKRSTALTNLRKVCEEILGLEPTDVTENKIFGQPPVGMSATDPNRELYLGADDIDMMKVMLFIEQEFNCEVSDVNFVPRDEDMRDQLWANRPLTELMDFCVESIMK